jgi:hypothetical protein
MSRGRGWIEPLQEIAHPAAGWNRGHIYLTKEDVLPGYALRPGDMVAFYLYADKKGLGAEECFPVQRTADLQVPAAWPPSANKQAGQTSRKQKRCAAQAAQKSKPVAAPSSTPATWWNQTATAQPKIPSPPQWAGCMQAPDVEAPPGLEQVAAHAYFPSPPGLDPSAVDSGDEGEKSDSTTSACDGSACDGSVTGKSTKNSPWDGSTCAGRSDKWSPSSKSTVSTATKALEKALAAGAGVDVFSDDGNEDEEPAAEPTPKFSTSIPVDGLAHNCVLPIGYKVYQI